MNDPTLLLTDQRKLEPAPAPKPPSERAYFTEGELLPWKGRWFRVHLNQNTQGIELEMLKPTDRSVKLAQRKERWASEHPNAIGPRRRK